MSVASIYAQKKLDELDKETGIQDRNKFIWEIKTTFSNKTKAVDAEWKIETFKQGKKNIVDFMIEFEALAIKVDTDELHMIFLLKKNVWPDNIKIILGYFVRHSSHWGGSPQNGLEVEQTCGMTLASAYVLCRLSATWSQLWMKERKSKWE